MGHPEDSVVDACETRHLVHFLRCCVDVSVLQVVEDGVVEKNCILTTTEEGGVGEGGGESGFREYFYCSRNRGLQTKARVGGRKRQNANDKNTVLVPSVQISL